MKNWQIENSSFPRKKFPRFPRFPSFRPGYLSCIPKFENESSKWKLYQCKPETDYIENK